MNIENILANLDETERAAVQSILQEQATGSAQSLTDLYNADYEEIPVDIDTFLESPQYLGQSTNNGKAIYPYWRNAYREIIEQDKIEIAMGGSIGCGKTTAAIYLMCYFFYKLMCLKDIRNYFGLEGNGPVCIAFLNNTIELSKGVAYDKFMSTISTSPWFLERGEVRGTVNLRYKPKKNIEFVLGSSSDQIIGRDIFCGILDEVNFSKGADPSLVKNKVLETYNACFGRIKNRFTINGRCQGRIFLVSSRKTEYDFLNQYIAKKQASVEDAKNLYVADAKAFEVKPKGSYSGRMFRVAVGGSNLPSKIPEDSETTEELTHQGYVVYDVPVELRGDFELDINRFIGDHLGIAVSEVTKFISYNMVEKNYKEISNPFGFEVVECNLCDNTPVKSYFDPTKIAPELTEKPIFIHIDTSGGKGDNCGISAVAALGFVHRNRYSEESGDIETTKLMLYRQLFTVGLTAKKTSEISFQKLVDFLWYLKYECGWNVHAVSTDGYMGQFLRQQISAAGFNEVNYVSLDRSPEGYIALQTILAEERISLMKIELLETELVRLERNSMSGKIDHPLDGCFTGDTKVRLTDGRRLSILKIKEALDNGETLYVYTCNERTYEAEPQRIRKAFFTKKAPIVRLTLDDGSVIRCSDNHRFLLSNGNYCDVAHLAVGTGISTLKPLTKAIADHFIANIEYTNEVEELYDLEIENTPNFALASGVFVHNSKDLADSLAGAVYNGTLHEDKLTIITSDIVEAVIDINQPAANTPQVSSEYVKEIVNTVRNESEAEALARRKANYEAYVNRYKAAAEFDRDLDDGFII